MFILANNYKRFFAIKTRRTTETVQTKALIEDRTLDIGQHIANGAFASTSRTIDKMANARNIGKYSLKFQNTLLALIEYSIFD